MRGERTKKREKKTEWKRGSSSDRERERENVNWCGTKIEITRNKSTVKYRNEDRQSFHTTRILFVHVVNWIRFVLFVCVCKRATHFRRSGRAFNQNTREQTDWRMNVILYYSKYWFMSPLQRWNVERRTTKTKAKRIHIKTVVVRRK